MQKTNKGWKNWSSLKRLGLLAIIIIIGGLIGAGIWLVLPKATPQSDLKSQVVDAPPTTQAIGTTTPVRTGTSSVSPSNPSGTVAANPTATPKKDAPSLLTQADQLFNNGQYNEAATQYRQLISNYPTSPEAAQSLLGIGRAQAESNLWNEAATTYQNFLTQYPNHADRRLAYFGLAIARKTLGQWQAAITAFQQYQRDTNLLDGYVNYELGEAYTALNNQEQAIAYYKKVVQDWATSSILLRTQTLEKLGDFYAGSATPAEALGWYNRILEISKTPEYRANIYLKMARVHLKINQTDQAYNVYNVIADQYLNTSAANTAIQALVNANPDSVDDYYEATLAMNNGNYSRGLELFNKVLGRADVNAPLPALPPNLTPTQRERLARARYNAAFCLGKLGNFNKAVEEYGAIQNWLPGTTAAEDGLWRVGLNLRQTPARLADASEAYNTLVKAYPNGSNAEPAAFAGFQIALERGNLTDAALWADRYAQLWPSNYRRDEIYYTLARAYAPTNEAEAKKLYQKVADSTLDSYYSARAKDLLAGVEANIPARSTAASNPTAYDPAKYDATLVTDRAEMEKWLMTWANAPLAAPTPSSQPTANAQATVPATTAPATLDSARNAVRDDAGVRRFQELRKLGRSAQATREAKEAVERFANRPLELYFLSLTFSQEREYYYSIEAAHDVLELFQKQKPGTGLQTTPFLLQKLIYPLAFQNIVLEMSNRYDLDPLMLLALIKQESAFDPNIVSSAQAIGLTQVIPSTGRAIATSLGKTNYTQDDLYEPYTSIEFGSYYLAQQLKNYKGQPYVAFAAYNGGAGNATEWASSFPPSRNFDDYVENVGFSETRTYIKILYSNYWEYRRIYK